jgi:hypothetical protein
VLTLHTDPLDANDPPTIPLAAPWALGALAALTLAFARTRLRRAA